jgi:hypothetical protein
MAARFLLRLRAAALAVRAALGFAAVYATLRPLINRNNTVTIAITSRM